MSSSPLADLGAAHRLTRPFRPLTNGKAERFNQALIREGAYAGRYNSNRERLDALPAFVERHNERRGHGSVGGKTPCQSLSTACPGIQSYISRHRDRIITDPGVARSGTRT